MEQTSEFWADVIAVAASPVAIAAGFTRGTYDAATGHGSFDEGFHAVADPIVGSAKKFGAEHGETITKGVLGGAAAALGGRIVTGALKHLRL